MKEIEPVFSRLFQTTSSYVRQQITRDSWANPDAAFNGSSNSSDKPKANRVRSCGPSLIAHKTSNHGCPYRLRGCCRPRRRPRLRDPPVSVRPRRRESRPRRSPARGRRLNFFSQREQLWEDSSEAGVGSGRRRRLDRVASECSRRVDPIRMTASAVDRHARSFPRVRIPRRVHAVAPVASARKSRPLWAIHSHSLCVLCVPRPLQACTGRRTTRTDLIPPCSPRNSSTRAVKALGSKSVAGLPVMARCVPLPDPPVCAEPLSRDKSNLPSIPSNATHTKRPPQH